MTIIITVVIILLIISLLMVSVQNTINNRKKAIRKVELNREYLTKKISEYNTLIDRMIPENIEKKNLADDLTKIKNEIYESSNDIEKNILKNNMIYNAFKLPSLNEEENKIVLEEYTKLYEKEYTEELKVERDEYNTLVEKFNNSIISFPGSIVSKLFKQNALIKFADRIETNRSTVNNTASHYNAEFNINKETVSSPTPQVEQESNLHMAHKVKPLESQVKIETAPETLDIPNESQEILASVAINNSQNIASEELLPTEETISEQPKIEEEKVEMPSIEQPKIEEEKEELPSIEQPTIEEEKIELPSIEQPKIEEEKVELPSIEQPKIEEEKVEIPTIEQPTIEEEKEELPSIEQPTIEEEKEVIPSIEQPKSEVVEESSNSIQTINNIIPPEQNEKILDENQNVTLPDPSEIIANLENKETPSIKGQQIEEQPEIKVNKEVEKQEIETEKKTESENRYCPNCNTLTDEIYCPNCGSQTE